MYAFDMNPQQVFSPQAAYIGVYQHSPTTNYAAAGCGSGAEMPRPVLLPAAQPGNSSLTMRPALSTESVAQCQLLKEVTVKVFDKGGGKITLSETLRWAIFPCSSSF